MAFTVEDGSGVTGATSYVSTDYVVDYAATRVISGVPAYAAWANGTSAMQEAACVLSSDYLDARYAWFGSQLYPYQQGLQWPRLGAYDTVALANVPSTIVPPQIMRATAELAVKVLAGTVLLQDLDRGGHFKSQSVAGLSISYEDGADVGTVYGITGLLAGLISSPDRVPPNVYSGSQGKPVGFYQGMFDDPGVDIDLEGDFPGIGPMQNQP